MFTGKNTKAHIDPKIKYHTNAKYSRNNLYNTCNITCLKSHIGAKNAFSFDFTSGKKSLINFVVKKSEELPFDTRQAGYGNSFFLLFFF